MSQLRVRLPNQNLKVKQYCRYIDIILYINRELG